MRVAIEYEKDQYLEFERHPINTIVGYNQTLKWKIVRTLYRFNEGKQLDFLEENVYGDDGLSILIDDKPMKSKQLKILCITSFSEMNQQLSISKNTLMQFFIHNQLSDTTIQHQFEVLSDNFVLIEQRFNELLEKEGFENISFKLSVPSLDDLIKQSMMIGQNDIPLSLMDSNQLIKTYLYLLRYYLENNSTHVFVLLRHEDEFLNDHSMKLLNNGLRYLTMHYPQLIILAVKDYGRVEIANYDTEEIIFVGDDIQQLPPFDVIKKSIYLNYPMECHLLDHQIIQQLCLILPRINAKIDSEYQLNMVLYNMIQKLLE